MEDVITSIVLLGVIVALIAYFIVGIRGFKKLLHDRKAAFLAFEEAIKPGVRLVEKDTERPIDPFVKWTPTYLKVEEVRTNTMGEKWVLVFDGLTSKTMQMTVLYDRYELL